MQTKNNIEEALKKEIQTCVGLKKGSLKQYLRQGMIVYLWNNPFRVKMVCNRSVVVQNVKGQIHLQNQDTMNLFTEKLSCETLDNIQFVRSRRGFQS